MSDVILIKQADFTAFNEREREIVRQFLFGIFDGFHKEDKKRWRRWWKRLIEAGDGELFRLSMKRDRSGPYHRLVMGMIHTIYEQQEVFTTPDTFLAWLKVGAEWVEWVPDPMGDEGRLAPVPRSISYDNADQDEFQQFHEQLLVFLRGDRAPRVLWPHLSEVEADAAMDAILEGFER